MNLKIFLGKFFNKAVIKSDFKKYWWVSALLGAVYLLFVSIPLSFYEYDLYEKSDDFFKFLQYSDRGNLACFAAFVLGGIIFSYLHNSGAVAFIHGMPVTRRQLYFSHILSGVTLIFIAVAALAYRIYFIKPIFGLQYLCYTMTLAIYYFSLVTMVSMAVGNRFAAYLFSLAVISMPAYIETLIYSFFTSQIPGYITLHEYTEIIYDYNIEIFIYISSWPLIVLYFICGYFLYKFRHTEKCGELLAYDWLKPIFVILSAFCFSSFAFIVSEDNWIIAFIVGAVTVGAAFMLIRRSVSLRGSLKYFGIYAAFFAVIFCTIFWDILGIKSYVPSADSIKTACFASNYDYGFVYPVYNYHTSTLDEKDINLLREFHRDMINEELKTEHYNNEEKTFTIGFTYESKTGIKTSRQFVATENIIRKHSELFNSMAFIYFQHNSLNDNTEISEIKYTMVEKDHIIRNKDNIEGFISALKKDMKNISEKKLFTDIYIENNKDFIFEIKYNNKDDKSEKTDYINIDSRFENTLKFLEEKDYLPKSA